MYDPGGQQQHRQKEWREKGGYQNWKDQQGQQPQRQDKGCVDSAGQAIGWIVFIGICLLVVIFIMNAQ